MKSITNTFLQANGHSDDTDGYEAAESFAGNYSDSNSSNSLHAADLNTSDKRKRYDYRHCIKYLFTAETEILQAI